MTMHILIAEDELPTRRGVLNALQQRSQGQWHIHAVENGLEALSYAKSQPVDLLITDIRMPGLSGIQLLEQLRAEGISVVSILLTGYAEFEYARTAMKFGAINYILKPFDHESLLDAVQEAVAMISERQRTSQTAEDEHEEDALAPKVRSESIQKALEYIKAELHRPSLSIKDVADCIHLNPSYTSVLFKEETKYTFSDFVNRSRLLRAKALLHQTDKKVYEIADQVGFSSSKYFVQVFRDVEGMTPNQYRNDHS
ncbi:response regulator transcription factor [Paenibacillus cremeus]|uniref:Response regulator n=1 Tax=Paenibacillus cremeus TaxID=2163881 RepID=A0A559K9Z1_9BACL|nr:response regulator [Paenibacillus cremeus]TVY08950.1 response regulator [Paenibacillus cremeus]